MLYCVVLAVVTAADYSKSQICNTALERINKYYNTISSTLLYISHLNPLDSGQAHFTLAHPSTLLCYHYLSQPFIPSQAFFTFQYNIYRTIILRFIPPVTSTFPYSA